MKTYYEIKEILVPIDFSEISDVAIVEATKLATLFKADIFLIHVIERNSYAYLSILENQQIIPSLTEVEKNANEKMKEIKEKIKKNSGISAHIQIVSGRVYSEIIKFSEENEIDLIVMGSEGASGYEEIFIGSNAQRVVTLSEVPVLTIQKKETLPGFKNVLIPIDNSLHSREKVNIAMIISNLFGAKIHLIGLVHSDDEKELKAIKIKLESVEKIIHLDSLPFKTTIVKGDHLAQEAMKYAEKENCDLIVINTGHESKLTGIFLGAFAQQIVNHSKVPVLSFKHTEGHFNITTPGFGV